MSQVPANQNHNDVRLITAVIQIEQIQIQLEAVKTHLLRLSSPRQLERKNTA